MGDVFANGMEVSGKAIQAQTIAAFPDVCMTPPENPATPPGVPVPYPNFAMASDTANGTSTVKVKDKPVNIKNKSDMSKTTGDEAGAAAKKGVITSKNKGKSYFNSWSPNVKYEGKPAVRMSDLTTNNHASPVGNTLPWVHIAKVFPAFAGCKQAFADADITVSRYKDTGEETECPEGYQREHTVAQRYGATFGDNYNGANAPTICMNTATGSAETAYRFSATAGGELVSDSIYTNSKPGQKRKKKDWSLKGSDHNNKTQTTMNSVCQKRRAKGGGNLNFGEVTDICVQNSMENCQELKNDPEKVEQLSECLKLLNTWFFCCEVCGTGKTTKDGCISEEEMRDKEITTYSEKVERFAQPPKKGKKAPPAVMGGD